MNPSANHPSDFSAPNALRVLGGLLEYPGPDFTRRLETAAAMFPESTEPERAALHTVFGRFSERMLRLAAEEREELYTATFDVTPSCVAYVSIHLFGEENFKRGEFMAALNARYAQAGFHARDELPDHLSNLLPFAAGVEAPELRELVEFCLLGPLDKMRGSLDETNPCRSLLELIRDTLLIAVPGARPAVSPLEQMRRHSAGCATVSAGCHCGPQAAADTVESTISASKYG